MQKYIREEAKRLAFNRAHFANDSFFGKGHQLQLHALCSITDKKLSPNISCYLQSDRDVRKMKANCSENDSGFAFQFEIPNNNGLSLHSVSLDLKDNAPMLTFKASNPFDAPSLTEQDVAVMAKLAMEGKRPEFVFKAIPPGHPLHGRQYKQYSPSWIKGTSIGDLLFEADWEMKLLSVGSKSNKEKTKFCSRHKTSKLPDLATITDFPSCKREGSIFMSCKSVTVEETDECLTFVGDPVMAITCDPTPAYGDYITAHYDSVAYYDEPLFLKMKQLMKLILGMEWLVKRGIKFNQKWIDRHIKKKKSSQSQAVELYQGKSLSTSHGKEVTLSLFTRSSSSLGISSIVLSNPKMPISLLPDVETWSELYNETVPWPKVSLLELCGKHSVTICSSLGGISTSNIPVTSVVATAATAVATVATAATSLAIPFVKPRVQEPVSTEPYILKDNKVSVKASKSVRKTTKPLRRRDKPTEKQYKVPPKDAKNNTDITRRNGKAKIYKTFGTSDSSQLFDENGERLEVKNVSRRVTASTKAKLQSDESAPMISSAIQFHGTEHHPESSSKLSHQPPMENGVPKPSSPQFDMAGSIDMSRPTSQGDEPTLTHDTTMDFEVEVPPASTPHTRFTTQCAAEASSKPMPQVYDEQATDEDAEFIPTLSSPTSFDISPMKHESLSKPPSPTDSGYSSYSSLI